MNPKLLQFLRCPVCLGDLTLATYEVVPSTGQVSSGLLISRCGVKFPIWQGVPRMIPPPSRTLPADFVDQFRGQLLKDAPDLVDQVAKQSPTRGYSFDVQWSMYDYGQLTWELDLHTRVEYFHQYLREKPGSLGGALVLDAGCGNGTLTAGIGASGPEIIGMDYSNSVERAQKEKPRFAGSAANRVHYVQGDVQQPPFAPEMFDIIYSDGVLHHTPDTRASFNALAPLVKPGGCYFVWLYRSDLSPMFKVKMKTAKTLQRILRKLPLSALKSLCFAGAAILLIRLRLLRLFGNRKRRIVPLRLKAVNLFDTLTPRNYHLHTPSEVREWFIASGFPNPVETSIATLNRGGFGMLGLREQQYSQISKPLVASRSNA